MSDYPVAAPALKVARSILDTAAVQGASVMTKLPQTLPRKFFRTDLVGGYRPVLVTHVARILVECWAITDPAQNGVELVELMAFGAIAALQNAQGTFVEDAFVRGFDNIDGPIDFPDPDTDQMERWQFTGDLWVSTS